MQLEKIMVPVDFSPSDEPALRYATSLARDGGATLLIVHAEEPPMAYGAGEFYVGAADIETSDAIAARLEAILPPDTAVPYTHRLLTGEPAHQIVTLASEEHVDLIVMGTHGRSGLMRLLMGSVAESVVRLAPCPVFTLRDPATYAVKS
jgi:nucleotide-binding universal stress UspA family protein